MYFKTEGSTNKAAKCEHKIVVLEVKSEYDKTHPGTPAPEIDLPHTTITADSYAKLAEAFNQVNDGDVVVLSSHANKRYLPVGYDPDDRAVEWTELWSKLEKNGLKRRPRLAMVFMAACMAQTPDPKAKPAQTDWFYQPLSHNELRKMRSLFQAKIAIAPYREYATHTGWYPGGKDERVAKRLFSDAIDYYTGKIKGGEMNERFEDRGYSERFGITFGCNGWNHPASCGCGFGTPKSAPTGGRVVTRYLHP